MDTRQAVAGTERTDRMDVLYEKTRELRQALQERKEDEIKRNKMDLELMNLLDAQGKQNLALNSVLKRMEKDMTEQLEQTTAQSTEMYRNILLEMKENTKSTEEHKMMLEMMDKKFQAVEEKFTSLEENLKKLDAQQEALDKANNNIIVVAKAVSKLQTMTIVSLFASLIAALGSISVVVLLMMM